MKKFFYDLETTGTDPTIHGIHQIAGEIEIDGKTVEEFNISVQPHLKAVLDPVALQVGNVVEEDFLLYTPIKQAYKQFIEMLSKYVDRFDRKDKFHLVGYNNRGFDDRFLRVWFDVNGDKFFGSWFWADSLDVLVLASQHLLEVRHTMPNFKLVTVAKKLGIEVDEDSLHDGAYDIMLTKKIYEICTK